MMSKDNIVLSTELPVEFRRRLLHWFGRNRRDLPWRCNVTPYSVWISEIMLQQTVVKAVIPYFSRWMQRFPDVALLAAAKEQEVVRLWEGLGYYRRARNLHRAAQLIMQEHGGKLPDDREELRKLPGVGEYTAAAIMSIAFGKPCPVLDANVRRVVSRLLAIRKVNRQSDARLRTFVQQAISARKPGAFNEAVMELGQTVCLSREPFCRSCPVAMLCQAYGKDLQEQIPSKKSTSTIRRTSQVLLITARNRILAQPRTKGIFADLWLLPIIPAKTDSLRTAERLIAIPRELLARADRTLRSRTHHYTRFVERLNPVIFTIQGKLPKPADGWQWLKLAEIDRYPFPSVYRRILDEFAAD